jgi:hypothetical protein
VTSGLVERAPQDHRVTLARHEIELAAGVGLRRQIEALLAGRPDRHGFEGSGWDVHVEGACGELAVARFLGRYWDGSNGTYRSRPDVGRVEVRTRSSHSYDLIVREDDSPDTAYVLVTGSCPRYWVRGWIRARDARRDEWLQTHGGRPPAWFVPASALSRRWPPS